MNMIKIFTFVFIAWSGKAFAQEFLKNQAAKELNKGKNVCIVNHYNKILEVLKPNGDRVKVLYFKALFYGEDSENKKVRELAQSYKRLGACSLVIDVDRTTIHLITEIESDPTLINKSNRVEKDAVAYFFDKNRTGPVCFLNSYNETIDEVLDDGSIHTLVHFRKYLTDKFTDYQRMLDNSKNFPCAKVIAVDYPYSEPYLHMFNH